MHRSIFALLILLPLAASGAQGPSALHVGVPICGDHSWFAQCQIGNGDPVTVVLDTQDEWVQVNGCAVGEGVGWEVSASEHNLDLDEDLTGRYSLSYNISYHGAAGKTFEAGVTVNGTIQSGCKSMSRLNSTNDIGGLHTDCAVVVEAGDTVRLVVRGTDASVSNMIIDRLQTLAVKI